MRKKEYSVVLLSSLICVVGFGSTAFSAQEFHLSNDYSLTYNSISGPGASQSSLTSGFRHLNDLNVYGNGDMPDQWSYTYNAGLKATDDKSNDPSSFSLTNMNSRFTNRIHSINLGDTFESMSQYSLNTSLKGISYRFKKDDAAIPEVSFVSGLAYPRWDNAFAFGSGTYDVTDRFVWGAKMRKNATDKLWLGASVVGVRDTTRLLPTMQQYDPSYVYSADLEYKPIRGLTLKGEVAHAVASSTANEDAASITETGNTYKLQAIGDGGPSRVVLDYERISPDFVTLVGSATPDREKAKGKWRYKPTKDVSTNLGLLWFHDNLNGEKAQGTTYHYKPETGVTLKKLMDRRYSVVDLSYKFDYAERDHESVKADNIANVNYRDRYGFIDSDLNFGYIAYNGWSATRTRADEFTYNANISSRHSFDSVVVSPSLYLGSWSSSDELADTTDRIYETAAGVGLDFPNQNVTSNFRGGWNKLLKDGGDDSTKLFFNATAYWRAPFLAKILQTDQGTIFARFLVNDFAFTTVPSRDYRENSGVVGCNIMF